MNLEDYKRSALVFVVFFVLAGQVFFKSVLASNVAEPIGWSARSTGMAGANKAVIDDCSALNTNPAALVQINGKQFNLAMGFLHPDITFTNEFGSSTTTARHNWYPLPEIAYVKKIDGKNLWLGSGIYFNTGAGANDFDIGTPYFPTTKTGYSKLGVAKMNTAAAFRIRPELSLGLALNIYYASFDLKSPMGPAYLEMHKATGFGYGFSAGLFYQPTGKLSLGISYTSASHIEDLESDDAYVELSPYLPPPFSGMTQKCKARVIDFQVPQKVIGSLSYKWNEKITFSLNGEWQNYSEAFHEITMEIYDADILDQKISLPINYKDIFVGACGMSYAATGNLTLRAGYGYCSDAVPSNSLLYLLGANDAQHNFAVGIGYLWDSVGIDFAWVHCISSKDYTKTSKLPGEEYNNSSLEYSDHYFNLLFSYHFK